MKIFKFTFAILFTSLVFISCKKYDNDFKGNTDRSSNELLTLSVGMDNMRVTATENNTQINFAWESGDKLNLMFEQNGQFYPATSVSPKTAGAVASAFDVTVPIQVDLSKSYNLYGAVNAEFDGNSANLKIKQTTALVKTLAEVQNSVPMYFAVMNKTGRDVSASLQFAGAMFKIYVQNKASRQINLSDAIKIEKSGVQWVYSANPLNFKIGSTEFTNATADVISYSLATTPVDGNQTATFYACVYSKKAVTFADNVHILATIDGKPMSAITPKAPAGNKFQAGKCYGLQLVFNKSDVFEASFTLPSMPIENLF